MTKKLLEYTLFLQLCFVNPLMACIPGFDCPEEVIVEKLADTSTKKMTAYPVKSILRFNKMQRRFIKVNVEMGGAFDDPELTIDASYADIYDRILLGDGEEQIASALLTGHYEDKITYGFGVTYQSYEVDGGQDYEQEIAMFEIIATYHINDNWSTSIYLSSSINEIEAYDELALVDLSAEYERYAMALMLSYGKSLGYGYEIVTTIAAASANKKTFADILEDDNSMFITTVDLTKSLSETLYVSLFGTYTFEFNTGDDMDDLYAVAGVDITYLLSEKIDIAIGWSADVDDDDQDSDSINLTAVYHF
ncbi:MAG: hypothetical protein HRT89_12770 [Lentisphaeria bacterium]|nr:hypothetical protein [Lentisphaeria bacterium]